MGLTDDQKDPRVRRGGPDKEPVDQHDTYLVLSEEERAKGFVRPVRRTYGHSGFKPKYQLRDLTDEQKELFGHAGYVKYEPYPEDREGNATGRFWTQAELDAAAKPCGGTTTMGQALAETYAREPHFYGFTYCCQCRMHRPVKEFTWLDDGQVVGS